MKKHGTAIRVGFYANSSEFSYLRLLIDQRYKKDKGFKRQMDIAAEAIKDNQRVIYMGSNHACRQVCQQKAKRIAYPGTYVEHWQKHSSYDEALNQIRANYTNNVKYARMLNTNAQHRLNGKPVHTDGKPTAVKALEHALTELIKTKVAASTGWQWLHRKQDQYTKLLEWKKISSKLATKLSKPCRELPLDLMQVYGYKLSPEQAWQQAAAVDKETALPNFVVMDEVWIQDRSNDMDLQDNPHFRNDNMDQETNQPEPSEAKVIGFEVVEVEAKPTSQVHVPVYSVERPKAKYIVDRKGSAKKETHLVNQDYLEDLYELDRKSWNKQILTFLTDFFTKEKVKKDRDKHRQQLIADEQEVENYAEVDAGNILSLLEEQLQQTKGKAPSGLVGALARARREANRGEQLQEKLLKLSGAKDVFVGKELTADFLDKIEVDFPITIGTSGNSICREVRM